MDFKVKTEAASDYRMVSKEEYCWLEGAVKSEFEETSVLDTSQQNKNKSSRTKIKIESFEPNNIPISTEIKCESEEFSMADTSHVEFKSNINDKHKVNSETEIKLDPLCWENISIEIKCESERAAVHNCEENGSNIVMDSVSVCEYEEMNPEIEIKEEPWWCTETMLPEPSADSVQQDDMQVVGSSTSRISIKDFSPAESAVLHTDGMDRDGVGLSTPFNSASLEKEQPTNSSVISANKIHEIHETKRQYICDICGQRFSKKLSLKRHRLNHEGIKSYKCDICDKKFTLMSDLKRHSLVHERNKPYKCEACGKSFPFISYLKSHSLSHLENKPHKCPVCDRSFAVSQHLKTHVMAHDDKRDYKCDSCEKRFIQPSRLRAHVLIHDGKKPFKCETCGKYFKRLQSLKTHKFMHGITDPLMFL